MNSLWLIVGSLAAFAVAYRFYGAFLAAKVAVLDDRRLTPAHRMNDGVDYHPTNKWVLFGHHFAAIAGPGPLIGPVLASQWGFFPGFTWIIIGACLAGAVHDFVILWASVREKGLSLPRLARLSIGPVAGITTSVATLFIVVCTLASVGIVVVNALAESPWGMFTIIVTIPAALLTGFWMYRVRPGRVLEASAIGVSIVLAGVVLGRPFAESSWGHALLLDKRTLALLLPAYAFVASVLPVWVLMCPRDYLSSYMKIGVMAVLGVGLIIAHPPLKMPAVTPFIGGGGPVISGPVWPFVCIVIMCGAISGFHALIASGTTPKMIDRESHIRPIGYGAMVVEGFVAVTALVAACAMSPGDYFAINTPQDTPAQAAAYGAMIESTRAAHGWDLAPVELKTLESEVGETLAGRTGGAVTLAVGMAKVFASLPGMRTLISYWYHFVIMFEALFILTLLETGTRVARFVVQEAAAQFRAARGGDNGAKPALAGAAGGPGASGESTIPGAHDGLLALVPDQPARRARPDWAMNIITSLVTCGAWGYLLFTGNINTLWRMLGIANQLLACIALAVGTTYLLRKAPKRAYALCTAIPFFFVVATTFAAGVRSVQGWWGKVSEAPAGEAFSLRLMCLLAAIMLALSAVIVVDALRSWARILWGREPGTMTARA